jgi:hypothetical protein
LFAGAGLRVPRLRAIEKIGERDRLRASGVGSDIGGFSIDPELRNTHQSVVDAPLRAVDYLGRSFSSRAKALGIGSSTELRGIAGSSPTSPRN